MIKKKEPAKKDIADILENYTTETGDDMYVMTGDALPNGEVKAKYFASNQMPRLKAGTDNMKRTLVRYFAKNITIVVALVLIWRGIWYVLDTFDKVFLNNIHIYSAVGGIILGIALLYFPDKDLKEIEKL